ncbi:MAG TPA: alpha-L-fucosidase [Chitinophagaceae bacterium]|nr:alpha-L-fucosidase [Chitinophagaceae bacterium]
MKKIIASSIFIFSVIALHAQNIKPVEPIPSARQLQWSNMEFYLFTHFGPNTFTDLEWGKGTEPEDMFNPAQLDCNQWCRIAKAAGAKGIIITAKHHDGFCLWPSKYSAHTVAQSKWRNGKGDVLKELSVACEKYNLKLGIYLSPWDRNHPKYGTDEYNDIFINMMKEVVSRYGPLFEFWWDGANGEGPNGKKQVYDWHRFEETMRKIAPNTAVFSDIGPDIRWVGNENGIAGDPNWNLLDTAGFTRGAGAPSTDTLNHGNENGKNWITAECDVSIRPGWFYHANEDEKVKTPEQLFQLYLKSVGRGANLLLNVPPDRRGLINGHDSAALMGFKKLRDESFENNLNKNAKVTFTTVDSPMTTSLLNDGDGQTFINVQPLGIKISFNASETINCIVLQEPIQMGQRIKSFSIHLKNKNGLIKEIKGTTIGRKRIITFPAIKADSFYIKITDAKATPLISEVAAYKIDDGLIEK